MQAHSRYRRLRPPTGRLSGIVHRFKSENMMQTAAALAFTTLLSLVPLVAVVLAVAGALPYLDTLVVRLEGLIREALLPGGAAAPIVSNIGNFSQRAQQLTAAGLGFLAITAFMLMNTIERAFNHVWRVQPRPLLARLRLYAFVMMVWPFILGAVVAATSFAVSTSLGLFDEPAWMRRVVFKGMSVGLLAFFFSFLYYAVPNVSVSRGAALLGGIFAALAFAGMQKLFELYLASTAVLKSVYGAFAAFPVFLVWLQLSWVIVLVGGLLVASFRPAKR